MICVSVGRGRHRMMMAEHKHLAESGAQLVELRVDYIRRAVSLSRLLKDRQCPTVIACRRVNDGGKWRGTEDARIKLLRSAVAEEVEYVDIEEDIAGQIPRYKSTKRIISYHNFNETPLEIEEIRDRMLKFDPDIIKIATMANRPSDSLRVMRLIRDAKVPTVAFCMGEIGMPSLILCRKFGAPFSYGSFSADRALLPGQLSYREMLSKYRFDEVNEETVVYGVIADPVAHSLSPLVHNANLVKEGINAIYLPFRVPRDDLYDFLEDAREFGIKGLSVTIPHKEAVLKSISVVDEDVAGIKASNTLVLQRKKTLGFNTDCQAAIASLTEAIDAGTADKPFTGRTALVLGSGGAAKAIVFGLMKGGATVVVSSRNVKSAEELADNLSCHTVEWEVRHDVEADLLINCTPVGMHPDVNESPFDQDAINDGIVVFDTVYNPEQTLLIKYARSAQCKTVTGVEMFVRQAALQFKLFTGKDPDIDLMRTVLKNEIAAARPGGRDTEHSLQETVEHAVAAGQVGPKHEFPELVDDVDDVEVPLMNIYLVGYRGTGKTTVGRLLADLLKWKWIDSDEEIQKQTGKSIADIFSKEGEDGFRDLESKIVKRTTALENYVVSLGGGAILREENRDLISASGKTVWLTADAETIADRLAADAQTASQRPQLTDKTGIAEIETLLKQRREIYSELADLQIDTEKNSPERIAQKIFDALADQV